MTAHVPSVRFRRSGRRHQRRAGVGAGVGVDRPYPDQLFHPVADDAGRPDLGTRGRADCSADRDRPACLDRRPAARLGLHHRLRISGCSRRASGVVVPPGSRSRAGLVSAGSDSGAAHPLGGSLPGLRLFCFRGPTGRSCRRGRDHAGRRVRAAEHGIGRPGAGHGNPAGQRAVRAGGGRLLLAGDGRGQWRACPDDRGEGRMESPSQPAAGGSRSAVLAMAADGGGRRCRHARADRYRSVRSIGADRADRAVRLSGPGRHSQIRQPLALPTAGLAAVYAGIIVFNWPILAVIALGLVEDWAHLRRYM